MIPYIISTDLDGTLLDHHTYRWQAAKPAMARLKDLDCPIVINTSKTAQEVIALQAELALTDPFIIENGSAIFIHKTDTRFKTAGLEQDGEYFFYTLGCKRAPITQFLNILRDDLTLQFSTFDDFSVADIISLTSLPEENAKLAKDRAFSEPLVWKDSQERYETFKKHVEKAGYKILRGGRFIHILGQTNKGLAAQWLVNQLKDKSEKTQLIALGDSHNDLDMLALADLAVLIKSPTSDFPEFSHHNLIKTQGFGPVGWNESIHCYLDKQQKNN